jgi:hypothetical protein
MGFFDSLFNPYGGSRYPMDERGPMSDNSGYAVPMPDLSGLDRNVLIPQNFLGRPRLARSLDNALLAAATFQGGQTTGENIGAVARNVIGLGPARQTMNLQRQMAPYLSMEPLIKMQGEMGQIDYHRALSDQARAMAEYYRAGGKQSTNVDQYVDKEGKAWQLLPNGSARPILTEANTEVPQGNLQIGGMSVPTGSKTVSGMTQLTGHVPGVAAGSEIERLINSEEAEDIHNGGQPWNARMRSDRWAQLAGTRAGQQQQGRIESTPGYVSEGDKMLLDKQLAPLEHELNSYNADPLMSKIMWEAANPGQKFDQHVADLQKQRQELLNKIPGKIGTLPAGPVTPRANGAPISQVQIPQPLGSGATDHPMAQSVVDLRAMGAGADVPGPNGFIGNVPVRTAGNVNLQDLIVPPGPRAARPAKPPKASKPSPGKRPRVTIDPSGRVSVE